MLQLWQMKAKAVQFSTTCGLRMKKNTVFTTKIVYGAQQLHARETRAATRPTMAVRITIETGPETQSDWIYEFDQDRIVIGRAAGSDVQIPHRTVSVHHATIRHERAGYVFIDEGSTNGSEVNGNGVVTARPKVVRDGDQIVVGGFVLRFNAGVAIAQSTSAERTATLARRILRQVVDLDDQAPTLTILTGSDAGNGLVLDATPSRLTMGRADECNLVLADADASREHAEVIRDLDGVLIRDLGSKNGIIVNDKLVTTKRLRDRDEVTVGATLLAFSDPAENAMRRQEQESDVALDALPRVELATKPTGAPFPAEASTTRPSPRTGDETRQVRHQEETPAPRSSGAGLDLLIYFLAAAVLVTSIGALAFLLRS